LAKEWTKFGGTLISGHVFTLRELKKFFQSRLGGVLSPPSARRNPPLLVLEVLRCIINRGVGQLQRDLNDVYEGRSISNENRRIRPFIDGAGDIDRHWNLVRPFPAHLSCNSAL